MPARLTNVENKSLSPGCNIDGSSVGLDFILEPRQKCANVFCHQSFILCDIFGCKLQTSGLSLDAVYKDITAVENSFFLASL